MNKLIIAIGMAATVLLSQSSWALTSSGPSDLDLCVGKYNALVEKLAEQGQSVATQPAAYQQEDDIFARYAKCVQTLGEDHSYCRQLLRMIGR